MGARSPGADGPEVSRRQPAAPGCTPPWETAGLEVLSNIADAIEVLGDASSEPNDCITPAERAVADLCPILLNDRMLAPVFAFIEKALVTNARADEAETMLQDPLSILETLAAITVGSAYEDSTRKAFDLVNGAMDALRDSTPWEEAPTLPNAPDADSGLGDIRDQLDDVRVWLDMMGDQLNFSYADAEQTRRAQERLWMLLTSAEVQLGVAIELAGNAAHALNGQSGDGAKGIGK